MNRNPGSQIGPTSRNWISLKKDGFLPSVLWPMNWPIQASTKMTIQLITNASREKKSKAPGHENHRQQHDKAHRHRQGEIKHQSHNTENQQCVGTQCPQQAQQGIRDQRYADPVYCLIGRIPMTLAVLGKLLVYRFHANPHIHKPRNK